MLQLHGQLQHNICKSFSIILLLKAWRNEILLKENAYNIINNIIVMNNIIHITRVHHNVSITVICILEVGMIIILVWI